MLGNIPFFIAGVSAKAGIGCNLSFYGNGTDTHKEPYIGTPPDVSPYVGDVSKDGSYIGTRYTNLYFSGKPVTNPVTPVLSGTYDRSIGSDYVGSRIELSITPFIHLEEWEFSFWTDSISAASSSA